MLQGGKLFSSRGERGSKDILSVRYGGTRPEFKRAGSKPVSKKCRPKTGKNSLMEERPHRSGRKLTVS